MNQKQKKSLLISVAAIIVIVAGFFVVKDLLPQKQAESTQTVSQTANAVQASGNMVIQKSSVTFTPSFYPYEVNGIKMEVIAVKASDGSVRTAFKTETDQAITLKKSFFEQTQQIFANWKN